MITYCKLISFYCDVGIDFHCHRETHSVLQIRQKTSDAYKEAKNSGWVLQKIKKEGRMTYKAICPYCKNKLTETEKGE